MMLRLLKPWYVGKLPAAGSSYGGERRSFFVVWEYMEWFYQEGGMDAYGNTIIYQAGDPGGPGTRPGDQVESGGLLISKFQGDPALPCGA